MSQFNRIILLGLCLIMTACGGGGSSKSDGGNAGDGDGGGGGDGGGDGGPVAPTNNLAARALEIISADPRIGYPLQVSVSIDADEAVEDVGLAFVAVDKDRVDVRQLPLGTGFIEQIDVGDNRYDFELDVPSSIEIAGAYYIGVLIDAVDEVDETDEGDNQASTELNFSIDPVPNLFIEQMTVDRSAIELQENGDFDVDALLGVVNSDAGATLTWGVKGTESPIEVETYAVLRLSTTAPSGDIPHSQFRGAITIEPTPAGVTGVTSHDVPLYLWNSEEERYANTYGVDTTVSCVPDFSNPCAPTLPQEWLPVGPVGEMLVAGINGGDDVPVTEFDRRSAHLDFYFPGKLAKEIGIAARGNFVPFGAIIPPPDLSPEDIQALRSFMPTGLPQEVTAEFCVSIRPVDTNISEGSTDDNEACSPVALLLATLPPLPPVPPPPPPRPPSLTTPSNPIAYQQLYRNQWGGKYFGFGMDFGATASADDRGAIIEAFGSLPVTLFGQNIEYIGVDGRAQVLPISDRDDPPAGQSPGFSLVVRHLGLILSDISVESGSTGPLEISFSKDVAGSEGTVWVGPVPVALSASISGNLGVQYQVNINENIDGVAVADGINLITTPFANAEASVSAAITAFFADVGVEGVLTLFGEEFNIVSGASINVLDELHTTDLTSEIAIVPRLRVINVLTGAKGAVNVFVSVDVPTLVDCSWGFFTGVCPGLATVKYPYNLASYTAWEKQDTLLDISTPIVVMRRVDGTVSYYQ